jgi:hypothetical protein
MTPIEKKILELLLDPSRKNTIGSIAEDLGYHKRAYANVQPYIIVMESRGWVKTEKDKTIKRPGAKPTKIILIKDLEMLKILWYELPKKREVLLNDKEFQIHFPKFLRLKLEEKLNLSSKDGELLEQNYLQHIKGGYLTLEDFYYLVGLMAKYSLIRDKIIQKYKKKDKFDYGDQAAKNFLNLPSRIRKSLKKLLPNEIENVLNIQQHGLMIAFSMELSKNNPKKLSKYFSRLEKLMMELNS